MALVKRAKRIQRRIGGRARSADESDVWCVFDADDHPNLKQAVVEARDAGIQVALSNPCFELWLVLHVEDRTAHVDRNAMQRRCREVGLMDGKTITAEGRSQLVNGYQSAERRAQELDRWHDSSGSPAGSNPSSGVWRLVDALQRGGST